jgi:hypothetical protein
VPQAGYQHDNSRVAWWSISAQERYEQLKFAEALPRGVHLLESAVDQRWAKEFARSGSDDPSESIAKPIKIREGPLSDTRDALAGEYAYRPRDVRLPVFIVYGG